MHRPGPAGLVVALMTLSTALAGQSPALAPTLQEAGAIKQVAAARTRSEYREGAKSYEEDIDSVMVYSQVPVNPGVMFRGPDRLFGFRAEKGQLDRQAALLQTIFASVRVNRGWFGRVLQVREAWIQNQLQAIRSAAELSRYIAQTTDEMSDMHQQVYDRTAAPPRTGPRRLTARTSAGSRPITTRSAIGRCSSPPATATSGWRAPASTSWRTIPTSTPTSPPAGPGSGSTPATTRQTLGVRRLEPGRVLLPIARASPAWRGAEQGTLRQAGPSTSSEQAPCRFFVFEFRPSTQDADVSVSGAMCSRELAEPGSGRFHGRPRLLRARVQ